MFTKVSYWEASTMLRNPDVIIVGSGLVGVNAAISLKEGNSDLDVLILEKETLPHGASTRNAGFACFGSMTELLDDLKYNAEENVFKLLSDRFKGLNYLRKSVGDEALNYQYCGGYEVFDKDEEHLDEIIDKIPYINHKIYNATGLENTFTVREQNNPFKNLSSLFIYNQYEGALNPGKMMEHLWMKARNLGVRMLSGMEVISIDERDHYVHVHTEKYQFTCNNVLICTNGFSKQLFPELEVEPSRNQVIVTEKIIDNPVSSCYHYDKGYVYFRNVDNRILLGGGRNIAIDEEQTAEFGNTDVIQNYLREILYDKIGVPPDTSIEYSWSGIMGTGPIKTPILRKHSEHIIFALRLGGMGVALGSLLGDQAAKILLTSTTK